jgi:hypothetical protein
VASGAAKRLLEATSAAAAEIVPNSLVKVMIFSDRVLLGFFAFTVGILKLVVESAHAA